MRYLPLLLSLALPCYASADSSTLTQDARQQVKQFATALKQTLKSHLQTEGAVAAIDACNTAAPAISQQHSKGGWQVGRTSLKLRNPDNQADPWEQQVLLDFEKRRQAGETVKTLETSALIDGQFRYMKAIPTGQVCLACHGETLTAAVQQRLQQLYPNDQATGFKPGDIRGAFSLSKQLQQK